MALIDFPVVNVCFEKPQTALLKPYVMVGMLRKKPRGACSVVSHHGFRRPAVVSHDFLQALSIVFVYSRIPNNRIPHFLVSRDHSQKLFTKFWT
ncbi:MAG: hypothetical protein V1685_03645 [Parcubacteria group bacterium]